MLASPSRTSTRILVLVAGLVLAAVIGSTVRTIAAGSPAAAGTAEIEVGVLAYHFEPTTCTVTETDFLAAGPGQLDDERFWVSASTNAVTLTLGSSEPPDQSNDDRPSIRSVGEVEWQLVDGAVVATVTLRDDRQLDATPRTAQLLVDCP